MIIFLDEEEAKCICTVTIKSYLTVKLLSENKL